MINEAIIIGNLGKDAEVKFTASGMAVANLSVATNERWSDKDGKPQERTEWHRVVVWGKLAELAGKLYKKGKQVFVKGRLQTRKWEKDGVEHWTTEIVGLTMRLLGPSGASRRPEPPMQEAIAGAGASGGNPDYAAEHARIDAEVRAENAKEAAAIDEDVPF